MAVYTLVRKFRTVNLVQNLRYSQWAKKYEYQKYYRILGIAEDSDQEQIRAAYLALVKKYHPDSGSKEANAEKFLEIDTAFKVLTDKKAKERWGVDETAVKEQDIQHTAPQHRQYLSYDGYGFGTPSQRQKQYRQVRAVQAADNVLQHRISKVTADEKALWDKSATKYKHKIKTKYGFERLVEDLIQESMSKGEFTNLSGCGKPLSRHENRNPFVDYTTHKINEVLIDNGFVPEWISLQKEIREEAQIIRSGLQMERAHFGPYPLSDDDNSLWETVVNKYEKAVQNVNSKINKYNLVVPILNKQLFALNLKKEAHKVLVNGKRSEKTKYCYYNKNKQNLQKTDGKQSFLDIFNVLFKN